MTDLETRLDRALKGDGPAAPDPMFRIAVLERRERAALRRRLLDGSGLAFGAAILATVGLAATETLPDGPERLAALAVIGAALTALLAAPWLGGAAALRGLIMRARQALPGLRLWP